MSELVDVRGDDGLRLSVRRFGEGPDLLLIPGLGATGDVYLPIIPALSAGHRVITYDPRGVGGSQVPEADFGMTELAADAAAVIRTAGTGRAHVFGASLGGLVAQYLALDHGDLVERLVLAATHPGRSRGVAPDPATGDALLGRGALTAADAYRRACTVLYAPWFQASHPEFIEAEVRRRAAHPVPARVFAAQLAASRSGDAYLRLPDLTAPTLVAHGSDDAVVPLANAEILVNRIPGSRRRWFPGGGHLFFHESPEETAAVVGAFLASGAGPARG